MQLTKIQIQEVSKWINSKGRPLLAKQFAEEFSIHIPDKAPDIKLSFTQKLTYLFK